MHVCRRARQKRLAVPPRRWKMLEGIEHRNIHTPNQQLPGCDPGAGDRKVNRQNFLLLGRRAEKYMNR